LNCAIAIALGDGRELFYVNTENEIRSYNDDMCIVVKDG